MPKRTGGLALAIMTESRRRWSSVVVHPDHLSQAVQELLAAGATLADLDGRALGVLLPDSQQTALGEARGVLIGSAPDVPRRAVLGLAEADTLNECLAFTAEALHRLDVGADTIGRGRMGREGIWTPAINRTPRPIRPEVN